MRRHRGDDKDCFFVFFCFFLRVVSSLTFSRAVTRSDVARPYVRPSSRRMVFWGQVFLSTLTLEFFPPPSLLSVTLATGKKDFHVCGRLKTFCILHITAFKSVFNRLKRRLLAPAACIASSLITAYWPVYLFWHNITSACVPSWFAAAAPAETDIPVETGPRGSLLKNVRRSKKGKSPAVFLSNYYRRV